MRNVAAGLVALLLWNGVVMKHQTYHWAVAQMLPTYMDKIHKSRDMDLDARWQMKLGAAYQYLNFIKQRTPEDAVILYPPREAFFPEGAKSPFQGEPYNKIWATRFLHPRRLVLHSEFKESDWAKKLTHVAVVNGVGYELFKSSAVLDSFKREPFAILPVQ